MTGPTSAVPKVFSLYRAHLREIRKLPHLYIREFYKLKTRNDVRSMLAPSGAAHLQTRLKRAAQGLRKLQTANAGNHKAFMRILDTAYGRNGKLKWELLQPLLKDPDTPLPPKITQRREKCRPPAYSKPLIALLTNPNSMATRPLKHGAWKSETLLPARANPFSEEAHIFGPFSKRRQHNIQRRFNKIETAKILPPIEVRVKGDPAAKEGAPFPWIATALPLQDLGVFEDIENLVGTVRPPPLTRKERKAGAVQPEVASSSTRHPSNWVRRRYRSLLARIPILTYTPRLDGKGEGSYSVQVSSHAFGVRAVDSSAVREIDDVNLAWLQQGMKEGTERGSSNKRESKTREKRLC